ncbi:hypothetical protein SOCE26_086040 [Sorangium cellulosum]|uniref:Secreted protein n=1 Tax=Sorangium cellulosum TaxID=56 RepID=A0A2L0F6D9_SORCE|nr:hypothetical protein [Sorangium cellulosum]AUX47092.1 hypothetical protein SOCE26_086040 [Sorangium cellulosum]
MRFRIFLCLAAASATATACGASINAVYEGDVRFEHCMALDAQHDVKPTLRRACWEEWLQFYTFGQTRDRVEYATLRQRQLSRASDFDEGDWNPPTSRAPAAVPEPTSALAPPPMLMTAGTATPTPEVDAGAADAGDAGQPAAAVADAAPPGAECSADCEKTWSKCKEGCTSAACEKECSGKYKRCMRRCF